MTRRLLRPLVHVLAIAQLLLSAPVISAVAAPETGTEMPCHGTMAPAGVGETCACCPDGIASTAGCLAQCAGATATNTVLAIFVSDLRADRVEVPAIVLNGDPADPPLKPPPIP